MSLIFIKVTKPAVVLFYLFLECATILPTIRPMHILLPKMLTAYTHVHKYFLLLSLPSQCSVILQSSAQSLIP